jgi:hypothetical protein
MEFLLLITLLFLMKAQEILILELNLSTTPIYFLLMQVMIKLVLVNPHQPHN